MNAVPGVVGIPVEVVVVVPEGVDVEEVGAALEVAEPVKSIPPNGLVFPSVDFSIYTYYMIMLIIKHEKQYIYI